MKTQIIATTVRFRRARLTSQSIIEKNSALHDGTLAGGQAALDDGRIALLVIGLDVARLKYPWRDFDEDAVVVILHDQRGCRHRRDHLRRSEEVDIGEHVGLQPNPGIWERNPHLGAPCVGIENVTDKENLAFEGLVRVGGEYDLDRLPLRYERGILFWDIRRHPDRAQVGNC